MSAEKGSGQGFLEKVEHYLTQPGTWAILTGLVLLKEGHLLAAATLTGLGAYMLKRNFSLSQGTPS